MENPNFLRKISAVALVILVYNLFFFPQNPLFPGSLNFLGLILTFHIFLWLCFWPKAFYPQHRHALITSFLANLFAATALFRASEVDLSLLGLSSFGLSSLTVYLLALTHSHFGAISEAILSPITLLFNWINQLSHLPSRLPRSRFSISNNSSRIITGLFLSLPFAIIIILLFASSLACFWPLSSSLWLF